MFVGILGVEFALHGVFSLKDKRRIAQSLKQKVRQKFNTAIAEVYTQDTMTRLRLALVFVSNDKRYLESTMTKCLLMIEAVCPEEMVYSEMEISGADFP